MLIDGIEFAEDLTPVLKVRSIKILHDYMMEIVFSTDEVRHFDFAEMLKYPAFQPLKNKALFDKIELDHGVPTWNNGEIDISPYRLYRSE